MASYAGAQLRSAWGGASRQGMHARIAALHTAASACMRTRACESRSRAQWEDPEALAAAEAAAQTAIKADKLGALEALLWPAPAAERAAAPGAPSAARVVSAAGCELAEPLAPEAAATWVGRGLRRSG